MYFLCTFTFNLLAVTLHNAKQKVALYVCTVSTTSTIPVPKNEILAFSPIYQDCPKLAEST